MRAQYDLGTMSNGIRINCPRSTSRSISCAPKRSILSFRSTSSVRTWSALWCLERLGTVGNGILFRQRSHGRHSLLVVTGREW